MAEHNGKFEGEHPQYVPLDKALAQFRTGNYLVVSSCGVLKVFKDGVPGVYLGEDSKLDHFHKELIRHIFELESTMDDMQDELDRRDGMDDEPWRDSE